MSGTGKSTDNKNKRRHFKRGERENASAQTRKSSDFSIHTSGKFEKKRGSLYDRPKWVPPVQSDIPIQIEICAWCNKPIKDIAAAFNEPNTEKLLHFDCVIKKIPEKERLEKGDTISYIGGGRFGIIHYNNPPDIRDFTIKKIFEWEKKENRSEWRVSISDHYSVT